MRLIATIALAFTATALSAQTQPQTPSTADIQKYLSLTDAQVQSLQQLRTQQRQANQSAFQEIQQKEQNLKTQLASGTADAASLGQILLDIQSLRKSIQSSETTYNTQALAVLNADQKTKLAALQAAEALRPQIMQATMLNLLTPPANAGGGPGMGPMGGPMGFRGPRAGFRGHRPSAPPQ